MVLLDTNVISELKKTEGDIKVIKQALFEVM